jgi:hypothetical protein
MSTDQQKTEQNKAYDLLDALSRSGCLAVDAAELHVLIAATHCFDKSLMNTLVQDNINPIEKLERSLLIVASTIQDKPALELIKGEHVDRVQSAAPQLFLDAPAAVPAIEPVKKEKADEKVKDKVKDKEKEKEKRKKDKSEK